MDLQERQQLRLVLAAVFAAAGMINGTTFPPEATLAYADALLALVKL